MPLRTAAAQLLERTELSADADAASLQVDRMTCEVRGAERTELVSFRLDEGLLQAQCTCGQWDQAQQRGCSHVSAALQLLAAEDLNPKHVRRRRESELPQQAPPQSSTQLAVPVSAASARLADALADVVTAVVRAGVCSVHVASVSESLARVERALPPPLPLGLLRWLGRMREALESQDTALAAHALNAAVAISADLRSNQQDAAATRVSSWFGGGADALAPVSDQSLVEVAREWLHGTTRHQLERRYLVDLESGECFREEYVRGDRSGSIGSCPRLIGVSLAEVEPSCSPRRLRLLQYTTTPHIERAHWDRLAGYGKRDSDVLHSEYRAAIAELGALAEPFVLVTPRGYMSDARPSLLLERGAPLPLFADDEPGVTARCGRFLSTLPVSWVAGRLLERAGQLVLRPLALGVQDGVGLRYERL